MRFDPAHFRHAVGNHAPRWPFEIDRASPQAKGLAACWPLFAGPGIGLRDVSGGGAHLVLGAGAETPSWIAAAATNAHALDFDGGDEAHVAGGNVAALDITGNEITLCAWIKPDTAGTSGGSRFLSKRTDAGGSDVYSIFSLSPGADAGVWFRIGGNTDLIFQTTLPTGNWQHWIGTYDGTAMRLYRNGVEVANKVGSGNIPSSARGVFLGHREAESRHFDGAMADVRIYDRALSAREVWALYDPATRWDLYRENRVLRVWPTAAGGGAVSRTAIGALDVAVRRQGNILASSDAALRAEAVLSALVGAALRANASRGASLDLAVQAVRQAQADLDTALARALGLGAGLDANLSVQGAAQSGASLDAAIRSLNLLSGALEATLRAPKHDTAALDAWLALNFQGTAGLDAVARRGDRISSTALQGILRATPSRAAAMDAILGLVAAAAGSRTFKAAARGGHRVAGGRRRSVIPSGNRRH